MSNRPGIYHDIGKKARVNEILPGLRTAFRFIIPYQSEVELQYLHDYAGITAGISLAANPLLNLSGVIGNSFFSVGTYLSYDTSTRRYDKYNAGLGLNTAILIASLTLNDMGDTLRASCYRLISPLTNTAVAAELTHKFSRNETTLSFGMQHAIFPITLVKARAGSDGKVGALIQQQVVLPSFFLTVAGDVDFGRQDSKKTKLGVSLAFRP